MGEDGSTGGGQGQGAPDVFNDPILPHLNSTARMIADATAVLK